jgi:hypothetical protein
VEEGGMIVTGGLKINGEVFLQTVFDGFYAGFSHYFVPAAINNFNHLRPIR